MGREGRSDVRTGHTGGRAQMERRARPPQAGAGERARGQPPGAGPADPAGGLSGAVSHSVCGEGSISREVGSATGGDPEHDLRRF